MQLTESTSNSCKNFLEVRQPTELLLNVSKLDLEAMINHHHLLLQMMSSLGNVVLPAQQHHGRSVMIEALIHVTLLPLVDLQHHGLEIGVVAMAVVVILPTVVLKVLATMPLLLETLLHGLSKLQLILQLLPPVRTLDIRHLATVVLDTLPNKLWELHLDSLHLLD